MTSRPQTEQRWQSKGVLLLVLSFTCVHLVAQSWWWTFHAPVVVWQAIGISAVFAIAVWKLRAGTPAAAATGGAITASLMLATARFPYEQSWRHGGLLPLMTVFLLTYAATKAGRRRKEELGLAEERKGRNAAQVAANLGAAALAAQVSGTAIGVSGWAGTSALAGMLAVASLAEAAADTVSSEIGQIWGGQPRLITSLRLVELGTDGAITTVGTLAGIVAAAMVAAVGVATLTPQSPLVIWLWMATTAAGVLGLFTDSLLGALIERRGWLNNDAVNFLSTVSAAVFSFALIALLVSRIRT